MDVIDAVFVGHPPKDEKTQTNEEKKILGSSYFKNKAFS